VSAERTRFRVRACSSSDREAGEGERSVRSPRPPAPCWRRGSGTSRVSLHGAPSGAPPRTASSRSTRTCRLSGSSTWVVTDCRAPTSGTPAPRSVASCRVRRGRKSARRRRRGEPGLALRRPLRQGEVRIPSAWSFRRARMAVSASRVPFCETPAGRSRCSGTSPRSAHSSCVTRRTSSTEVVPATTFSAPAARIVRIRGDGERPDPVRVGPGEDHRADRFVRGRISNSATRPGTRSAGTSAPARSVEGVSGGEGVRRCAPARRWGVGDLAVGHRRRTSRWATTPRGRGDEERLDPMSTSRVTALAESLVWSVERTSAR